MKSHPRHLEAPPRLLDEVPAAKDHHPLMIRPAATALKALCRAASGDGLAIVACSGFRSLDRQTTLWNRKFDRAIHDGLSAHEAVAKVLEYSAPPGWSRHHWGSDVDLWVDGEDEPRLEPADWEGDGPCATAFEWLVEHARAYGFMRPYQAGASGYLPEPWHWSFVPTARPRVEELRRFDWKRWLATRPYKGATEIGEDLGALLDRFVFRTAVDQ